MRFLLFLCVLPLLAENDLRYTNTVLATPNLVSYWRLDEPSGNFADLAGGNACVPSGTFGYQAAGLLIGDSDTAATFDGSTSKCAITNQTPYAFDTSSQFSIEYLLKPNITRSGGTAFYMVFGKIQDTSPFPGYAAFLYWTGSASHIALFLSSASTSIRCEGGTDLQNATTYHVAILWNGGAGTVSCSKAQIYLNGAAETVSGGSSVSATITNSTTAKIGGRASIQFFPGVIDEVAIYNALLHQTVINNHYYLSIGQAELSFSSNIATNIIWDDDSCADVENITALNWALRMNQLGYINILAIINDDSSTYGPSLMQTLAAYAGYASIPIGVYKGGDADTDAGQNTFCQTVATTYLGTPPVRSSYSSDVSVYTSALNGAANNSVVVVMNGAGTSAKACLADTTCVSKWNAKVTKVIWAAGLWPTGSGEYNLAFNSVYAAAGNYLVGNLSASIPLEFAGIEMGNAITGASASNGYQADILLRLPSAGSPVYDSLNGVNYAYHPWEPLSTIRAGLDPSNAYFGFGGSNGTAAITLVTGANAWSSVPNAAQSYLSKALVDGRYQWLVETYMYRAIHPFQATWAAMQ